MPLIFRIETDMFTFSEVADYMVNPVNLMSAPGAGLALEFRKRVPDPLFFEPYRAACKSEELRIGTVQILEDTDQNWGLINFPTKRHYADVSDKDDIVRGLEALREHLLTDKYRYCSIGMPMLGCGLGTQDYPTIQPLMEDYLGGLDATVFLSMSPVRTELRPKYLLIVGPPEFGLTDEDKLKIEEVIDTAISKWGMLLSDYTAVVSGGEHGVDQFVCGEHQNKKYEDTLVFKRTTKVPFVVRPNKVRNGVGANLLQSNLLCEIADDIILFKPHGHNNNRMSAMQMWIEADKLKREKEGKPPRRVAVFGDKEMTTVHDPMIIPVTGSDY